MNFLMIFYWIIGVIIGIFILYQLIKAAVKNGILEAYEKQSENKKVNNAVDKIAQQKCPECKKLYDIDLPKCPHCGALNTKL